jgi:hypothetical protein
LNLRPLGYEPYDVRLWRLVPSPVVALTSVNSCPGVRVERRRFPVSIRPAASRARTRAQIRCLTCWCSSLSTCTPSRALVLSVPSIAAFLGPVAGVSRLAKRPRSGLALTRRTRLRQSCGEGRQQDEPASAPFSHDSRAGTPISGPSHRTISLGICAIRAAMPPDLRGEVSVRDRSSRRLMARISSSGRSRPDWFKLDRRS